MKDPRQGNAQYYDLDEAPLDDIPFYLTQIPPHSTILELGCGTGRTLIPLTEQCAEIIGVDYSKDMIDHCRSKLPAITSQKCKLQVGDITTLDLHKTFTWVIAPYRVLQALASDQEVDGFFATIKRHLAPGGQCILNVFNPKRSKAEMLRDWPIPEEQVRWEKTLPDGSRVVHSEWYERITENPMVLYPHLIYRKYKGDRLIDELKQSIKMRCYYPDEFKQRIESYGFQIVESWGGYRGEKYGEGKELVVKFKA